MKTFKKISFGLISLTCLALFVAGAAVINQKVEFPASSMLEVVWGFCLAAPTVWFAIKSIE